MKRLNLLWLLTFPVLAVLPPDKTLPIGLAPHELAVEARSIPSLPPLKDIHSLPEWEESEGVMILWPNSDYIRKLSERGRVYLIADDTSGQRWWETWLKSNQISDTNIRYWTVPTDSVWVRDYGPWFILSDTGEFGLVDTRYNRPRPLDDKFPQFVSNTLHIPRYELNLTHTGGNYYNDGLGNAFSSTLVFSENSNLSEPTLLQWMKDFLGIERYTTSRLAPGITIQHVDTFGKLVSPDTWVFGEFPKGSSFHADAEAMVENLKLLTSPFGTPYRILRMPMVGSGTRYHAYINSFISNQVLYYPTYGDEHDANAKRIYQEALPGYEIVGVNAESTVWGDSVHCRSRNLLSRETLFLFPRLTVSETNSSIKISVAAYSRTGSEVESVQVISFIDGVEQPAVTLTHDGKNHYMGELPFFATSEEVQLYFEAKDSSGFLKRYPATAPSVPIKIQVR